MTNLLRRKSGFLVRKINQMKGGTMKNLARMSSIVFLVLSCLVFGGQLNLAGAEKGVLKFGIGVDATILDPHNYKAVTDLLVINLIYENLVTFDVNMKLVPALATSWVAIDDTSFRFMLRKGVKFHDGTPFKAEAVKINIDRMKDAPRSRAYFGIIESATIEDDYTIVVKLKRPYAPFLKNLCHPAGGMISPNAIEKYRKELGHHPVGTGRFKLSEWRPKEKLVLVRNEDYWGEKAKLEKFIYIPIPEEGTRAMAFESGEIDVISDPLPHRIADFKANKNITVTTGPATRMVWVGFNTGDKVLKNVKLRQAIGHAINRDEIVKYVIEGLAINAQQIIPGIIEEFDKKYNFDYNPKKAKKLLKEAGYPKGLELNLWTPEGRYLKDRQIAEAVQAQLGKIGIKTKLRVMEWGAYLDSLFRHEQQLYIIGWGFSTGDPDAPLRSCFFSTEKFNFSNYQNSNMDALLDKGVSELDPNKRHSIYEDIQQLLIDEAVMIPIYHKLNIYATSKKVKNFYPHPMELIEISETTVD